VLVIKAPHPAEWQQTPAAHEERRGRRRGWIVGSVTLVLCASGLAAYLATRSPTPPASPSPPVGWLGLPSVVDGVSCPSVDLCVVAGAEGMDSRGGPPAAFVTTDGGDNWVLGQLPGLLGDSTMTAVSCPTTTTCLGLDDTGSLVISADGGLQWHVGVRHVVGLDAQASEMTQFQCLSGTRCLALDTTLGSLMITNDGGATWHTDSMPTSDPSTFAVSAFACSSLAECVSVGSGAGDTLFVSRDGGGSWKAVPTPFGSPVPDQVSCPTPEQCLVITSDPPMVFVVSHEGASWTAGTPNPLPGISVSSLTCSTAEHCIALGTGFIPANPLSLFDDNSQADITDDGGVTWRQVALGQLLYPIAAVCPSPSFCMALDHEVEDTGSLKGAVVVTHDGGSTWILSQPHADTMHPLQRTRGQGHDI
jgi:photosystem II stability/assembly factor-like uncharacterized protein